MPKCHGKGAYLQVGKQLLDFVLSLSPAHVLSVSLASGAFTETETLSESLSLADLLC